MEPNLNSEINTLGYPRAALFGFGIALVAYNTLAVLQAALRRVHGAERIDHEVSGYYLAEEVSATYNGMMIALPPSQWGGLSATASESDGHLVDRAGATRPLVGVS